MTRLIHFIWDHLLRNKPADIDYPIISKGRIEYYVHISFRSASQIPIIMIFITEHDAVKKETVYGKVLFSWM